MTEYEYMDVLVRWEEKRNMFSWKIYDFAIWEYVRFGILSIVLRKLKGSEEKYFYSYIKENNAPKFIGTVNEIPKKILKHKDVLVVNTPSRVEIDGMYVSRFIDKMLEYCEYSYYVLERETSDDISKFLTRNIIRYNPDNFAYKKNENKYINSKCDKLIRLLERDFSIELDFLERKYIKDNIYSVIQNRKVHKNYYKVLLRQIRPKVIVVVSAAEQTKRYLIEVAKEMGIITVEYLHGFTDACCLEEYYGKKHNLKSYADYIWFYGRSSFDTYRLPIKDENLKSIGSGYHNWRIENIEKLDKITEKKLILVISDFSKEGLDILAVEIAEMASDEYIVMFKLHPGERNWRTKYPILVESKVKVVGLEGNSDIYQYLYSASYIIGSVSTALSEAVELDNNIYIYTKCANSISSEYLCKNGSAEKVDSAEMFMEKIKSCNKQSRKSLYEANPIDRMNKELDILINREVR